MIKKTIYVALGLALLSQVAMAVSSMSAVVNKKPCVNGNHCPHKQSNSATVGAALKGAVPSKAGVPLPPAATRDAPVPGPASNGTGFSN